MVDSDDNDESYVAAVRDHDQVAATTPLSPQGLLLDMTHRPRRSNPDTIQYLRQLPVLLDDNDDKDDEDAAKKEGNDDDEEKEKKHLLSYVFLQALREIRHELASVAGTEIGSVVLERMMGTLLVVLDGNDRTPKNKRPEDDTTAEDDDDNDNDDTDALTLLWTGLSPYLLYLATHRYGSHVVQRLIGETARRVYYDDSGSAANDNDVDKAASSSAAWIVAVAQNLDAATIRLWLTDPCASHVLRSLLAALSGRCYNHNHNQNNHYDMTEKKKKKNKKQQHKKKRKRQSFDEEYTVFGSASTAATTTAAAAHRPPPVFAAAFDRLRGLIWDQFDDNWPYHTSACPVLLCLLQLIRHNMDDKNKNRAYIPMPIIQKISSDDKWMYDATASRFWQALVETSAYSIPVIDVVHTMAGKNSGKVPQYLQHDIANYCVQTMLEHHWLWIDECLKQLPYLLDLTHQRRGVVWKLAVAICGRDRPPPPLEEDPPQQQQQTRSPLHRDHIDTIVQAIQSYGLRRFALEGGPPSLSTLLALRPFLPLHVWTTPSSSSSNNSSSLMNELCRHSLASQILLEPWIEQAKERFPLPTDDWADLARHPVGHHVLAKYVLTTRTVPDGLLQLFLSSSSSQQRADPGHPILKRLLHERLQLPLYQEKGAKAWRKALFGSSGSTTVVVVMKGEEEKDTTSQTDHRDTKKRKKMRKEKGTK